MPHNTKDDTISRQAAIEKVIEVNTWFEPEDEQANRACKAIRDYIEGLSSVQSEIIRCGERKHRNKKDLCDVWEQYIGNDDFYCGCAERREDG